MTSAKPTERNLDMLHRVLEGELLQSVATTHGDTLERVRQIVLGLDPYAIKVSRAVRREKHRIHAEVELAKRHAAAELRRRHGTTARWHAGCRCEACRAAWRDYCRQWRERNTVVPSTVPHGRTSTYRNYGCRCEACRATHLAACTAYKRQRRLQRAKEPVS